MDTMTLDAFFSGYDDSRRLFEALCARVEGFGTMELRVSKSQVALLRRGKAFARVWVPGRYLRGKTAPLVLTLSFHHRDQSPRWKEVVEPYPGRFTHHLELYAVSDVDDEVGAWLEESWESAG